MTDVTFPARWVLGQSRGAVCSEILVGEILAAEIFGGEPSPHKCAQSAIMIGESEARMTELTFPARWALGLLRGAAGNGGRGFGG